MKKEDLQKLALPDKPGVYMFLGPRKKVLYVGKANSLKNRVKSYFASDLAETRGTHIVKMVEDARTLRFEETDSILEALILEANLIKKHDPPANARERDNRSFNYIVITREAYPRVLIVRGRELFQRWNKKDIAHVLGPYPQAGVLREALRVVRAIFPFRDSTCKPESGKPCFNRQIGLCPGVCEGAVSKRDYARLVRRIALLFSGKKRALIKELTRDMRRAAKEERFEEAKEFRRQIGALMHIRDVSLIKREALESYGGEVNHFRIEAYDVAHTSGSETVGVMTVVENGEAKKGDYRMFKVRGFKNDDTGALKEVLDRRLAHPEWPMPRLIVLDGGKGQLNAARAVLKKAGVEIPTVAVVKDEHHRPREVIGLPAMPAHAGQAGDSIHRTARERDILLANREAHRFALAYHRKRRRQVTIK